MLEIAKEAKVKAIVNSAAASALGRMMVRYFKIMVLKLLILQENKNKLKYLYMKVLLQFLIKQTKIFYLLWKKITSEFNVTIFFDAIAGSFTGQFLSRIPNTSIAYVYGLLSGSDASISPRDLIFKNQTVKGF
ncbi:hypothetical protein ABPG74_003438 [Tetrahymena malaccensis]